MDSVHASRIISYIFCLSFPVHHGFAQNTSKPTVGERRQSATSYIYSPGSGDRLQSMVKMTQYQKLVDERNYELVTSFRAPSINGGEQVDREVSEHSRRVNDTQYQVERVIRTPDPNGRLATHEMIKEDHQFKGSNEEVQKSYYRSDINGKLASLAVENVSITKPSPTERQVTRAVYRPDIDGKFSIAELEESIERKVSEALTVKESNRSLKGAGGGMTVAESLKETTTKSDERSFKKETIVHQAGDNGRLVLTDKVIETQTQNPDGMRKYQRLLESRNVNSQLKNLNSTGLTLSQRVTGEERRLPDGSIESTTQVESMDPFNQSKGLLVTEIVTEITKPLPNGKISVERIVKTRDVNGNYTVSQKIAQTVEPGR